MAVDRGFLRGAFLSGVMLIPNPSALAHDSNNTIVIPSVNGTTAMTAAVEMSNKNVGRVYEGTRKNFAGTLVGEYDLTDPEEKMEFDNKVNGLVREAQVAQGAGKLKVDLNQNMGISLPDPNGVSHSAFAVTKTEQEWVGRVYRGGTGPGNIGTLAMEYDLNDKEQRKQFENSVRIAQYENYKQLSAQAAATPQSQPVPPTVRDQPPQAAVTQPLQSQMPAATAAIVHERKGDEIVSKAWVENEQAAIKAQKSAETLKETQAEMAAEQPVVPAVPQSAAVEAANREQAKTMTADSEQYASDTPLMGVLDRQQNPVAAAMQDLQTPNAGTVITHGYYNNGNFGSLALRNVGDGRVNAYLGNGRSGGNGQIIGEYDLNNPASKAKLENDLGVFVQNDAAYTDQHSRRGQFNNRATNYGQYPQNGVEYRDNGYQGNGVYAPQTGGYGYGSPYNNSRMDDPYRQQQREINDYYRNSNQAMNMGDRNYRNGRQNVNQEIQGIERGANDARRVFDRMASGRGGPFDVIGLAGPALRLFNGLPHVLGSVVNPNPSDPRPGATYPNQVPYPQYPQQQYPNQQPQGYTYPNNNGGGFFPQ